MHHLQGIALGLALAVVTALAHVPWPASTTLASASTTLASASTTLASASTSMTSSDSRRPPPEPEVRITTLVQDPRHPDEPWEVTSYRGPDESAEAFARRHLQMVEAVRQALR